MRKDTHNPRPPQWLALAALWLGIGIVDACQTVFPMRAQGMHHAWIALAFTLIASWLPWALATPLVMRLTHRFPVLRGGNLRGLLVHLGMLAVLSIVSAGWFALFEFALNPWALPPPPDSYLSLLLNKLSYDVLRSLIAYTLIIVISEFLFSRDRLAESQTEAAELRAELSESKLALLRQQMDPHFIFNALNSVCGLVRDKQDQAAIKMLVALSSYMRNTAQQPQRPLVSLGDEVHLLKQYLDIQKCRFGDRLQVLIDVPADILPTMIPRLLLQPLAENAIKHGISARVDGGAIRVSGFRVADKLQLTICNSAPNAASRIQTPGIGMGLSNLRARLQLLYRDDQTLRMERTQAGDVEVQVILPIKLDGIHAAA
jgi:hypothetical protein